MNIQKCADINIINGHVVLPEVMAPDADLCKSLVRAGRAAEVQAEIERREWLRSAEGRAHMAAIPLPPPPSPQEMERIDAAYVARAKRDRVARAKGRAKELARINHRRAAAGLAPVARIAPYGGPWEDA